MEISRLNLNLIHLRFNRVQPIVLAKRYQSSDGYLNFMLTNGRNRMRRDVRT